MESIQSKQVEVLGSTLHYLEVGQGDPILFIHGLPASSYLWRQVLPKLASKGRCLAIDLIGCGASGKPDIDYSVFDHIRYLEAFIEALGLKRLTLVMHAWGSVIGLAYAMKHSENVKNIVVMEGHIRPTTEWSMVSLPVQEIALNLNAPDGGYDAVVNRNALVENVLPKGVLRALTAEEMENYRKPFPDPSSRRPLWQFVQEIPLGDQSTPVLDLIKKYSDWLCQTSLPKLIFYAVPGFNTSISTLQWAKEHMPNLILVDLGDDLHYFPETQPDKIAAELGQYLDRE